MHGDEQAGIKVIERLKTRTVPANVSLWLIPSINPDGTRVSTRTNAHKVDLNRNFPRYWVYSRPGHVEVLRPARRPASRRPGP